MADARMDEAASDVVESVYFSFYTTEEIKNMSVKKITKPDLLDAKNAPVLDGLYDPALGPLNYTDSCKSCGQLSVRCPGHCGHIELARPIFHPLLFRNLKALLQVTCFYCHNFKLNREKMQKYALQLELIMEGKITEAKNLDDFPSKEMVSPTKKKRKFSATAMPESEPSSRHRWTSLQHSEALLVLSKFMVEKHKKCDNCGRRNPTINSPMFGWFNKTTRVSDIRANTIRESDSNLLSDEIDEQIKPIGPESQIGEDSLSTGDGATLTDDESAVLAVEKSNAKRHLRDLPAAFVKQMHSIGQRHLLPSEVEFILEALWINEDRLCRLICDIQGGHKEESQRGSGLTMYLLKTILVPPSKFRPPAGAGDGVVLEHPQNTLLSKVLEANVTLSNLITRDPKHPDIVRKWMDLQQSVNVLFDSTKGFGQSERELSGIRQLLERKAGILRQKMMGKRVNHACRTVISPDPFIAVNEIGIPPHFASRLTYPVRVTSWNVDELRSAILNGADIHPGATHYKDKDRTYKLQVGKNTRLAISRKLPTSRISMQPGQGPDSDFEGKVLYRHLRDGDVVLVNRQPTLHKPSMMAHIVRVLPGLKTFRMHYANCSTYNADFDGDEMNVHLPQDEISRAEAFNIANANKQYTAPTSGDPIRGLIQDHIISAVLLTKKDTFLTRDEFNQLLYSSCVPPSAATFKPGKKVTVICADDGLEPPPPAIWKPTPLWTGKQVITTILNHVTRGRKPCTMKKDGKVPKEYFGNDFTERELYISDNEVIHGMIDKAQFGKHGLIHIIHELYGADTAGILLSMLSRLFTTYLHTHGFTCGIDDLLVGKDADLKRKAILETSEKESEQVHLQFANNRSTDLHGEIEKVLRTNMESETARLDRMMSNKMNAITSEVNNALFPHGLVKAFPSNCLSLMTATGAKGGLVNMTQISSLLGQQELEGKRVPRMVSGKTLPCFPSWDISSRAGGFISDRFLTGLRPQEYYFHCMAGRDGLVDTAIKTSRSGYLQRCLIKNLEALKVSYDYTVRDADGSIVQFMYGNDGVDVQKASFLNEFEVLASNKGVLLEKLSGQFNDASLSKSNGYITKLPDALKERATAFVRSPLNEGSPDRIGRKDLMKLLELKYLSSLAEPGEPVGVIAAQSVGEPSTQMTLNTFHLAGRGEMNVTLGIPRLQEILMNAKENISTPIMTCPLLDQRTKDDAEDLAATLRRITVADIMENVEVCTVPYYIHEQQVSTLYKLKMKLYHPDLLNMKLYHSEACRLNSGITLEAYEKTLKDRFVNMLEDAIAKHLDMVSKISGINAVFLKRDDSSPEGEDEDQPPSRSSQREDNDGGGGSDDEDGTTEDQGADAEKRKRQSLDEMEYEDGLEPKSLADEHDVDGLRFGSEIDQVEIDEDYVLGGELPNPEAETEALESPSKSVVTKDVINRHEPEATSRSTSKRRKKIKRVIKTKFEKITFESWIIFQQGSHILLAEILQKVANKVFLKESKKIKICSVIDPKKRSDPYLLQTAGVNFGAFWDLEDHLDINRIATNNIHAMLNTYGVEAAGATILKEVKGVFGAYGIQVDSRHLELIASFMTCHGGYRPMNRLGMSKFATSPFGKMTYETATRFIVEAAMHGEVDTLESPSASVCLGQPVKMGTGCFDLLQNLRI